MEDFVEIGESYFKPIIEEQLNTDLVMYLIVRESLQMSIGKTAAQVAHAAQKLQQRYQEIHNEAESYLPPLHDCHENDISNIPKNLINKIDIFYEWSNEDFCKVVLKADEKEWVKLKLFLESSNIEYNLIIDAGRTELLPNTETVIGLWPMEKNQVPKIINRLQALK